MPDCLSVDPLVTPYVDGELAGVERDRLERHLRACPPCYSRVEAERAVRALLHERQPLLRSEAASGALRARCAGCRGEAALLGATVKGWRRFTTRRAAMGTAMGTAMRVAPLAAAAALVLAVGGALLYQGTLRPSRLLAAELAADHVKCFALNAVLGTHHSSDTVEQAMNAGFGWRVKVPEAMEREGLELVGSRPCLYGAGKTAHIMYRHHGKAVSLFMLPRTAHTEGIVEAFGHECAIWSGGDRTFVLVSNESKPDVERLAAAVHTAFH